MWVLILSVFLCETSFSIFLGDGKSLRNQTSRNNYGVWHSFLKYFTCLKHVEGWESMVRLSILMGETESHGNFGVCQAVSQCQSWERNSIPCLAVCFTVTFHPSEIQVQNSILSPARRHTLHVGANSETAAHLMALVFRSGLKGVGSALSPQDYKN